MLSGSKCVATVATNDMVAARGFYVDTLGLTPQADSEDALGFILADGSSLMVYHRPEHRAPENTALTFVVSDTRKEVEQLRSRGISFEDYDMPGMKTVEGIADDEYGTMAWFKDPAGNIIAVMTMAAS
jgi:catechol 2,3-dioxygenase-like lactoylglutathione lyase family enzyme